MPDVKAATEQDWYTEYLDLIMGVKVVEDLTEAIAHINKYGTKHSESIITRDFAQSHNVFYRKSTPLQSTGTQAPASQTATSLAWRRNRHQHPETSCTRTHERAASDDNKVRCFG